MDLRELDSGVDPATHWYYRVKRIPLERFFDAVVPADGPTTTLIDVGAGSGVFSEALLDRFGPRLRGVVRVDLNYPEEVERTDARLSEGTVRHQRALPAQIDHGVILLNDVLEHVPDDGAFLRSIVDRCRGENHVFITVPAFQGLWSAHDVLLGHYRRYSLPQLRRLAESSGVDVRRAYYYFGFALPVVWVIRRVLRRQESDQSDLQPCAPWLNRLLVSLGRIEARLCYANVLGGVTAVIEGRVRGTGGPSGPSRTAR